MNQPQEEHEGWNELGTYPTSQAAEIDAAYLRSEGIRSMVTNHLGLPGQNSGSLLWVDNADLNRARWFLKLPPVSEAELEYLATGELPQPKEIK